MSETDTEWTAEDWAQLDRDAPSEGAAKGDFHYKNTLEAFEFQSLVRSTARWCGYLMFNLGIARGMETKSGEGYLESHFYPPLEACSFRWFFHYAALHVGFSAANHWHDYWSISKDLQVFARDAYFRFADGDALIANCAAVEQTAGMIFRDVPFKNRITYCETGHFLSGSVGTAKRVDLCSNIGGHWLCDDCIGRFMLAETVPPVSPDEKDPRKIERAKMTLSLRYSILLRDRFTCKGCGRSPNRGDDIKLHVDHIVAIALGGKTVPENLQTLCDECNLGKGTSPWLDDPQLSMF